MTVTTDVADWFCAKHPQVMLVVRDRCPPSPGPKAAIFQPRYCPQCWRDEMAVIKQRKKPRPALAQGGLQ
jgi:hypothetical protein